MTIVTKANSHAFDFPIKYSSNIALLTAEQCSPPYPLPI